MTQKNENENIQDNKHIHIHNNILMKIHIIPRIGKFYSFVFMIIINLNNFSASWELQNVQIPCRFEYVLVVRYIFNN